MDRRQREPPAPANSESEEIQSIRRHDCFEEDWHDVSHGLVRYNWTSGTVYDEYRDDYSASNQTPSGANNFYDGRGYVVTSDYKVYKCLKTGKSGGAFYDGFHKVQLLEFEVQFQQLTQK